MTLRFRALTLAAGLGACHSSDPAPTGIAPDAAAAVTPADLQQLPRAFQTPPTVAPDDALRPPEVVHFTSGPYRLVGFLYRPNLTGALPAIVYNHGSEPDPTLEALGSVARFWQARGLVAFVPFRRGSRGPEGSSEGPYWKTRVDALPEAERDRATVEELEAHGDDVLAAVSFLASQEFVDRRFVAVSGCSFGGIETVLAAQRSPDVYAALDFAGASFTWARSAPIRDRMTAAVRASRVPILFLQAENDHDTTPSRALAEVMRAAGKTGTAKIYPPYGDGEMGGHAGFCNRATSVWGDDALAFLREAAIRQR